MANHTAVICGVARTPIGRFMGTLSSLSSIDLGVAAVKELCQRVGFDPSSGIVDDLSYFGSGGYGRVAKQHSKRGSR